MTCFSAGGRHPLEPFAYPHWSLGFALERGGPQEDFFRSREGKTLALYTAFDGSSNGLEGSGVEKFAGAFDFRMINPGGGMSKNERILTCFFFFF